MFKVFIGLSRVVALFVPAASKRPEQDKKAALRSAAVRKIVDGDTVMVIVDRRTVTLRLEGIDCPENGQHWGNTAKAGLIKLIGGKQILIEERCIDQYGRTVATIYVQQGDRSEWANVNTRMVALGHAWVSRLMCQNLPKKRQDELLRIQRWARNKRVGLWRVDDPIPPWKFRRSAD